MSCRNLYLSSCEEVERGHWARQISDRPAALFIAA